MIRSDYPADPELPPALRRSHSVPFVGRAQELAALRAALPEPGATGSRAALVAGEAGSGKSRLVRELAHEAAGRGALVVHGSCDAAVPSPYRPVIDCLDHLLRCAGPDADLGPGAVELTRLLPELEARLGTLPAAGRGEPDGERHRLHSAIGDFLARAADRRPVMMILEDLHWADGGTLLCLRHLPRATAGAPVLVVGTYRDDEAEVAPELSEALADLQRVDGLTRVQLAGLVPDEVAEFVRRVAGVGTEPPDVAAALGDLTGGNPFLLGEVWRALVETQALVAGDDGRLRLVRPLDELASPRSVRDVVTERLRRLSRPTAELLQLAAVAGADFDLDTIRRASALDESELVGALEALERCGMLEELPGRGLAYRFAHELVRRAIGDRLGAARRAELHLKVARALEVAPGDDARRLASLAHHFTAAAALGVSDRAVDYSLRAARASMTALAYDDAVALLRAALDLGVADEAARGAALLDLGVAGHRGGRTPEALAGFREAAAIADRRGDADLFARAAIGFEEAWWRPGFVQHDAIDLLEEAATRLGGGDGPLRVMVLAGLSRALARVGLAPRAGIVRAEAVAMARRLGEPGPLAAVLAGAFWHLPTSGPREVLDELGEARDVAERIGDPVLATEAMAWRVPAFIAVGDLAAAGREVAALREAAAGTRQPFKLHVAEHSGSAIALCEGRLADAEEMAERSREWSLHLTGPVDASAVYGIQMFGVRREQGRLAELAPLLRLVVARGGAEGPWRPGLAALLAELGMLEEARAQIAAIRDDGVETLRRSLWVAGLAYLAEAAAATGDASTAELVYPHLEPLAGGPVMVGYLVACYGSADRHLGMLAATCGHEAQARAHFEAALDLDRYMGARTWLAHTAYQFARLLLGASDPDDRSRAAGLLAESESIATAIGMPALLDRVRAVRAATTPVSALPDDLSGREAQVVRLIARGRSNREIGVTLSISQHTVANHVRSILRKTRCANRAEVAAYAVRRHLLAPTAPE